MGTSHASAPLIPTHLYQHKGKDSTARSGIIFTTSSTDERLHQFILRRLSKNRRYLRFGATPILRLCRKIPAPIQQALPNTPTPNSPQPTPEPRPLRSGQDVNESVPCSLGSDLSPSLRKRGVNIRSVAQYFKLPIHQRLKKKEDNKSAVTTTRPFLWHQIRCTQPTTKEDCLNSPININM